MRSKIPIGAITIPLLAELFRKIRHNCDRKTVVRPRQGYNRFASFRLNVRCVNHNKLAGCQALGSNEMKNLERIVCRGLSRRSVLG